MGWRSGAAYSSTAFFPCSGECSPVDRKSPMREEQEKDAEGGTVETKQNGEWVDG